MSATKSPTERYQEKINLLQGYDLDNLHLRFLGEELDIKTIGLTSFEILDKCVPASCDEVASLQKFEQYFHIDWQQHEDVQWSNYCSSVISNNLGMNMTFEETEVKTGRDYYAIGLENDVVTRHDMKPFFEGTSSSKSTSASSTTKATPPPPDQKPKKLLRLSFEQPLAQGQMSKAIIWEFLKIYLPLVYKLVLAAYVQRSKEREAEALGSAFKLEFQEIKVEQLAEIEELLNIKLMQCYISKNVINKTGLFYQEVLLQNQFNNYDRFLTKYAKKEDFETGKIWQLVTNLTKMTNVFAIEPQNRDPANKSIEYSYDNKKAHENVGWVQVRQLGGEKGVAKKNFIKTVLFFAMFFPKCCKYLIHWIDKNKFECCRPKESESPLPSLNTSQIWNQIESRKKTPEVAVGKILESSLKQEFSIEVSENTFVNQDFRIFEREWPHDPLEGLQLRSYSFVGQVRNVFKITFPASISLDVQRTDAQTQNEAVFLPPSIKIRVSLKWLTDDKGDLKHFYKDIRVTRLRPDVNPLSEEEVQLRTNIAVFSALEGWCSSLQQLIASKLAKNEFSQAIARLNSEPQLIRSDSELSHAEGTQTFPEAELRRGLFGTAMIPDLKALEITTSRAIVPLRNLVQKDPHFQQQDGPALDELIRNIQQGADIDEALEKYLRNSTETEFTLSPVDLVQNPIEITVFDENTRQLLWSAKLVRPVNWTLEMLEMVCRRFKNLLSCRLIKKANFERISTIDNIRKVLNVTNN